MTQSVEPDTVTTGKGNDVPRISLQHLLLYQTSDAVSEVLIYVMVVCCPWAFGSVALWVTGAMNVMGYALGALLLFKVAVRRITGYRFSRWDSTWAENRALQSLTRWLMILTVAVLAYCLVAAWNSAATFNGDTLSLVSQPHISWLPHSYDGPRSWAAFGKLLAIALSFWALRDWILGKTPEEERMSRVRAPEGGGFRPGMLPERLRRLLWVLTISGALLAFLSLLQQIKMLGDLRRTARIARKLLPLDQFGPFSHRANACQYFNLIWPVCLGFWWTLQRVSRRRKSSSRHIRIKQHHLALLCVAIMIVCPLVSGIPAGVAIAVALVVLATIVVWLAHKPENTIAKGLTAGVSALILLFGLGIGWGAFGMQARTRAADEAVRVTTTKEVGPLVKQHPVFGMGPGTFASLFQVNRLSASEEVPQQLHNDWIETVVTFGILGFVMILAALFLVLWRWRIPEGVQGGRRWPILIWGAMAACLIHAWFDYPFQVYSILFAFVVICAILSCLGRPETAE